MEEPDYIHVYQEIRLYVELASVAAGSISGALHALRRGFDMVGVIIIAMCCGLGGGVIRDMMLGQGPVLALRAPNHLIVAVLAALPGALFGTYLIRMKSVKQVSDSLTLGLFAIAGVQRGEVAELGVVACILLGVVTSVGGGIVRDVLCRETPEVLLPGHLQTPPAVLAGIVYLVALRAAHFTPLVAETLGIGAAVASRMLTTWLGWEVPSPPLLRSRWRSRAASGSAKQSDAQPKRQA